MAKKNKKPINGEENSNPSSIFDTLFGGEQNPSPNSLFSDENPFRRKPIPAPEVSEYVSNLNDSDFSELPKARKRKPIEDNPESFYLESQAVEKVSKKLKKTVLVSEIDEIRVGDEKKKKKKRKRDELETEYEAKRYGVVKDEVVVKGKSEKGGVLGEKRKKIESPEETMVVSKEGFDDEDKLLRTVFVGNLPLKVKKKELVKEFGRFGDVESVRIRSVPITDSKIPRKGAVITKQFNENGDRFDTEWL